LFFVSTKRWMLFSSFWIRSSKPPLQARDDFMTSRKGMIS
jgi:hypothetical protein